LTAIQCFSSQDARDAKVMVRAPQDALKAKGIEKDGIGPMFAQSDLAWKWLVVLGFQH
jgi:hypothetical protein